MRIATVSDKLRRALCWLVALSVMFVAACGGPGDQTTAQTSKEKLTLTIDNTTLTLVKSAVVTATVVDGNGAAVVGEQVTFSTDSNIGTLTPANGVWKTDGSGVATITLSPGPNPGAGTITATTAKGTTASLSYQNTVSAGAPASVQLLVSSSTLLADGNSTIALTAIVKDANNNTVRAGQLVQITSDSGAVTVDNSGLTDANGKVTATLSSPGDLSSRTINLKAIAGTATATNQVTVSGTSISISGVSSLVTGTTTPLTIRLRDGAGKAIQNQAIALSSALGNRFTQNGTGITSAQTDSSGQVTITYNADKAGADTVGVSSLNTRSSSSLVVSNDQFVLSAPPGQAGVNYSGSPIEINLNTATQVQLNYTSSGTAKAGITVNFSTTRGSLSAGSAVTDANGNSSVNVSATTAGPAVITASTGGVSAQLPVLFVATTPYALILTADNNTLAPNSSTTVTATLKDAAGNLVKNQIVVFNLTDPSGGTLSVAQGVTDGNGQTTTTYRSSANTSAKDAVQITASVQNKTVTANNSPLKLSVSKQALFVRIGTGNTVVALNDTTTLQQPFTVFVSDVTGNPIVGATVQFNAIPTGYRKGYLVWNKSAYWIAASNDYTYTIPTGASCGNDTQLNNTTCWTYVPPTECANEDTNHDGIVTPGNDTNHDGMLWPGNVANITASVTTDANGIGTAQLTYPRDHALWVSYQLSAHALAQGTEGLDKTLPFVLPGVATDYTDSTRKPPGQISPYGTSTQCVFAS